MVKKDMTEEEKEIFKIMGKIKAEEDGVKDELEVSDDEDDNDIEVDDAETQRDNDAMEEDDIIESSDSENSMQIEVDEDIIENKADEVQTLKPKSIKKSKESGKANVALFSSLLQDVPELDINMDDEKSFSESKEEVVSDSNFVKQQKKQKKVEEEMEIRRVYIIINLFIYF